MKTNLSKAPRLSVIVCTYNRERLLEACLESFCAQDAPPSSYEIVVVDNNSEDGTRELVERYERADRQVRYAAETKQGLSHARNKGFEEARGEYLAYVDDDALVPSTYVSSAVEMIDAHEPDIAGGPVYPYYEGDKPRWFKDEYETRKWEDASGFSSTCRISGGNFIIRRRLLKDLGLFDPTLGMRGERIGLLEEAKVLDTYRLRIEPRDQKVYYSLECYVKHLVPASKMTISSLMERAYMNGRQSIWLRESTAQMSGLRLVLIALACPLAMLRYFATKARRHGLRWLDRVRILQGIAYYAGMGREAWSHLLPGRGRGEAMNDTMAMTGKHISDVHERGWR